MNESTRKIGTLTRVKSEPEKKPAHKYPADNSVKSVGKFLPAETGEVIISKSDSSIGKKSTAIIGDSSVKATSTVEPNKKEKKPLDKVSPQNLAEFINYFYSGKIKTINESTHLKIIGTSLDQSIKEDLFRFVAEKDISLQKTCQLMLISTEIKDKKEFFQPLLKLITEFVVSNPFVKSNGMQALLFPPYGDEHSLEDAWEALSKSCSNELKKSNEAKNSNIDKSNTKAKKPPKSQINQIYRNALLCSVIWRINEKHLSFPEAMSALRKTLFNLPKLPTALEAELLKTITIASEKEDSNVALLLRWQARQESNINKKLVEANDNATIINSKLEATNIELSEKLNIITLLQQELEKEKIERGKSDRKIIANEVHGKSSYEELRAISLVAVQDSFKALEDVLIALSRDPPKIVIAENRLNSIVDSLKLANKKLKEI